MQLKIKKKKKLLLYTVKQTVSYLIYNLKDYKLYIFVKFLIFPFFLRSMFKLFCFQLQQQAFKSFNPEIDFFSSNKKLHKILNMT